MRKPQGGLQATPVVGLVIHAGRIQLEVETAHRLVQQIFIIRGNRNVRYDPVGGKAPLDLLLGRHVNGRIALDHGLARQRVSLLDIGRGKPQRASATDAAAGYLHRAAPAATLSAAGLTEVDPGQTGGIDQHRVG